MIYRNYLTQQVNENAGNYVLLTVIYAGVLFVGSVMTGLSGKLRLPLLFVGLGISSVATVILSTMPIVTE
jgi:membrane protein YqaA with SNARE-associated domain